jgi:hypothetical protein
MVTVKISEAPTSRLIARRLCRLGTDQRTFNEGCPDAVLSFIGGRRTIPGTSPAVNRTRGQYNRFDFDFLGFKPLAV